MEVAVDTPPQVGPQPQQDVEAMATDDQRAGTENTTDAAKTEFLTQLRSRLVSWQTLPSLKRRITFVTDLLSNNKDFFINSQDYYHYFCLVTETALTDPSLHSNAANLNGFYGQITKVCYDWICLSQVYHNDYRYYNCIQYLIHSLAIKLDDNSITDNNIVNQSVPLMLKSMIVIVATIHSLSEVVIISRAITTDIILKRRAMGSSLATDEWKQLISCVTNVSNVWKHINDMDPTDVDNLAKFVVRLVDLSLGSDPFLSHLSAKAIKCLSHEKDIELNQLFIEYQVEISSHILRLFDINDNFKDLGDTLYGTMSLFGIHSLPRELLKYIVPHFVLKCDHIITKLFVEEIARIDDKGVVDVIKIYLTDIIMYLFYNKSYRGDKSFESIQNIMSILGLIFEFEIGPRIRITITELMVASLMLLSVDKEATLKSMALIQYYKENRNNPNYRLDRYSTNESALGDLLLTYFLPFVHKYDLVIQDMSTSIRDKLRCTQSFICLMDALGAQHLNKYRVKLFSTIKLLLSERFHCQRLKPLMKLNIEVVMHFIKIIDHSFICSQLLTISALSLPLIHVWPKETKKLFRQLIVQNKINAGFQAAFKHLYFIPECNELKEVTEVLKPYITCGNNETDIYQNITLVMSNINHENSKVQEFSLVKMLELLTQHQSLIYKKCNNVEEISVDYFVNRLVTKLMVCLKSNNETVLQLVAQCLGILGAIDPLRIDLEKPVISKEDNSEKFLNSNDKEFKRMLITILYKAITTATKTDDQNCASFALQEIVREFDKNGFDINELAVEPRDFYIIMRNAKYKPIKPIPTLETVTEPIFGSSPDLTYNDWLNRWIPALFRAFIFNHENHCENSQQNENLSQFSGASSSQRSDLFEAELANALSKNSIKNKLLNVSYLTMIRNQSFAQFMLPYVVITALKNASSDQKRFIVNEVKTIITILTKDDSIFDGEIGHLSSQTVFHIYDYLKIWYKKRICLLKSVCTTHRQLKTAKLKDKEFRGVEYFLDNISTKELSDLAFKCNAFFRSLRYLEDYVKTDELLLQEEIHNFQKICLRLDEPDSVDGCNCKRIGAPLLTERILTHEAMGQIQEAMLCCAKAVEHNPSDFELQRKYLQTSMDNFDQSEQVYTYGCGLMTRRPEWRRKLAPFVIEAVWKLGDWTQLDYLIKEYDSDCLITFGSGIGDLFNCITNRGDNEHEVSEKLTNLRRGLLGPLSAAAMEISGYVRGHEFIVDLHILNDIQLIHNKLIAELDEDVSPIDTLRNRFLSVVCIWNQRNDLAKKTIKCQEPILNAQRAMLSILAKRAQCSDLSLDIKKELFKSWLMSTKTSRKSGNIQRSYTFLLEMNKTRDSLNITYGDNAFDTTFSTLTDMENCDAIIETAKIEWNKNKIGAIQFLKKQIEQNYRSSLDRCFKMAVNKLGDTFSSEEIMEIRNSMTYGSSSIPSYQSSIASTDDSNNEKSSDEAFAKLQLLYAKYCDQNGLLNQNNLAILYKIVTIAAPNTEESHFNLGMYCHRIYKNYEDSKRNARSFSLGKTEEILEMKGRAVRSLIQSLKYGVKHAHNSLPLLLNIWFDLGTDLHNLSTRPTKNSQLSSQQFSEEIRKTIVKINDGINGLLANVPLFIFFIVFGQLTARVLHPNITISSLLKKIILKLIRNYPQQTMWLIMRSLHSTNNNRKNYFRLIVEKAINEYKSNDWPESRRVSDPNESVSKFDLPKFIEDMIQFGQQMTAMSQKDSMRGQRQRIYVKQMSFSKDFIGLNGMFRSSSNFSKILLPFRSLVNVTLPKSIFEKKYNPFPTEEVYIERFDDSIEVLHSLQRPKKITVLGSDGKRYTILCKPGDDLRKDYCFLEICNLLNRCFKRDSEARRRQLKVKTYLVVSLTDNCGLIEWIPGLTPFRTLVEGQYRLNNRYDADKDQVIRNYPQPTLPTSDRVRKFQNEVLAKFKPSVFGNWFASTYTDPLSWFAARLAYTRSSAVFSIVGYLLGLGDRHGENIMIEELSGETVHVDLNCMFNKGEDFAVPEKVPFRLTHNMVHAMGVTEFEGTFRKACEHTLRVARDNKEAAMNFVTPFRYDHLHEWGRGGADVRITSSEYILDISDKIVFNIESRLNGIPSRNDRNLPKGVPLSVEGQVDTVIKEATDLNNLGVMYVGWTPFL